MSEMLKSSRSMLPPFDRLRTPQVFLGVLLLGAITSVKAETIIFDRWNPSENVVTFESRAPAELLIARTRSVSGVLCMVDRLIAAASGEVAVETGSFASGVALRDETIRSQEWLNSETRRFARFTIEQLVADETVLHVSQPIEAVAHGTLEIRGVTQEITVPATLCYMAPYLLGDPDARLFINGEFSVDIARFGMNIPRHYVARINPEIVISLRLLARGYRASSSQKGLFPVSGLPSAATEPD